MAKLPLCSYCREPNSISVTGDFRPYCCNCRRSLCLTEVYWADIPNGPVGVEGEDCFCGQKSVAPASLDV